MSILLPSRSLYQPQGAARINWDNPITRGLVTVFLPGTPNHRDLVGGATDNAAYRAPIGGGSRGMALSNTNPSNPWTTSIPISHVAGGYAALTTFCLYEPLDTTTVGMIFGAGDSGTYPQYFYKNAGGTMSFAPSTNGAGLDVTTSALAANRVYTLCGIARYYENFRELYVDGVSVGTNTANGVRINSNFTFLGSQYSGGVNRCLRVYAFYCWTRELTVNEVRSLTENPWQIFEPQQRKRVHHIDFGSAPTTGWTYRVRLQPTEQPAAPTLNWGHPIADSIVAWQTGFASSGFTEAGTVSTPVVATARGFARRFTYDSGNTNKQALSLPFVSKITSTAATLAVLVKPNNFANATYALSISDAAGTNQMYLYLNNVQQQWIFTSFQSSPSFFNRSAAFTGLPNADSWHFVVGRAAHSNYRDIWVNGVQGGNNTLVGALSNVTRVVVGGNAAGSGSAAANYWDGDIAFAAVWNRGLTDNEIRSLSSNPWQLFQQPRRIHAGTKIYRPYSDITTAGWTARPDAPYFRQLAETVPSDSNYIFSPDPSGSPGAFVAGLNASMDAGTYNIKFRARKTTSAGQIRATLLDASGSSVGASGWIALTTGFADYTATVTSSAPAARIKLEVQP